MARSKIEPAHLQRDEWGLYRRELTRLFLVEGVPIAEIANYMREEHGFDRKLKDYEYRLKKWNLRRKLHERELRFIQRELSRRRQAGRPSEVVVSGIRWSESVVLGRLHRHKRSALSNRKSSLDALPEFLARVQTPSPLMLGLAEWPRELPWLQFDKRFCRALRLLATKILASNLVDTQGREPLLIQIVRPYIITPLPNKSKIVRANRLNSQRKIRAVLEVIAPQAHEGDHETTAEILHTGSQESLAKELVRLLIYLEANNMIHQFKEITGYDVDLFTSSNMMDFLREMGFLTKANVEWLSNSTDPISQAFSRRLLEHSIVDERSLDVLKWLIPSRFKVDQPVQVFRYHWINLSGVYEFITESVDTRNHKFQRTLLQASSLAGNINAVNFLLELGVDPYETSGPREYSPLECAASLPQHTTATIIANLLLSKETGSSFEFQKEALDGAFELATARAHTELITILSSERKRLGNGTASSHYLGIAAKHGDCETLRLLASHAPRGDDGSVQLPRDILFLSLCRRFRSTVDLDWLFDKFEYLLELGADPAVSRCRKGCDQSFILYCLIGCSSRANGGESSVLQFAQLLRNYGCPPEIPRCTPGADRQFSALQAAIYRGYPRLVECLLDWGADIDHCQDELEPQTSECDECYSDGVWLSDIQGRSPLLTALFHGQIGIAKLLLRRKPNLKLRGGEQKLAMKCGDDTELVMMLLQADSAEVDGWEDLLEQAIWRRNQRSMELLLSIGNSPKLASIDPTTLLRAALITGDHLTAYQQLSVCEYDPRALFEGVIQSHTSKVYDGIVQYLLGIRPDTQNNGFEVRAVACAAINGDTYLLRILVESLGQGPWVAQFPDSEDDETLLSNWIFDDDNTCSSGHILDYAAILDRDDKEDTILKRLLEAGVPAKGMQIESFSAISPETLKLLISAGADPKRGGLLLSAVRHNMLEHVEVLCESGVPLNTMQRSEAADYRNSRTPVQVAVELGSPEMLQKLLHYEADVLHPAGYYRGATCLQLAAGAGNIGLVRLLLHKGSKVNAKRSFLYGRTAIEIAAENGRLDVLKLLLLQDEDLFQTTAERYQFIRATRLAERNGYGFLTEMLRQHIDWSSGDQRLFDALQGYNCMDIHLDDMTQTVLEDDRRDRDFSLFRLRQICFNAGFEDSWNCIKEWIAEDSYQQSDEGATVETDCIAEGNDSFCLEDWIVTEEQRDGEQDILGLEIEDPTKLLPVYDNFQDAMTDEDYLLGSVLHKQPADPAPSSLLSPTWGGAGKPLAPQAIRCEENIPMWLDDPTVQIEISELMGSGPVAEDMDQEFGTLEFWGDLTHINDSDTGDNVVNHNSEEGEWDVPQFDWGFWDEEGVGREFAGLDLNYGIM